MSLDSLVWTWLVVEGCSVLNATYHELASSDFYGQTSTFLEVCTIMALGAKPLCTGRNGSKHALRRRLSWL